MKKKATGGTLGIINTVWAMIVGTLMLWWVKTDLYPHLIADGSLDGDIVTLGGTFLVAILLAAPSLFKSRVADALEAFKEWKAAKGDD